MMANYAFMTGNPIPDVESGHVFYGDNFIQQYPNTEIFTGKTGLKFVNCNLTNCKLPQDAITEGSHPKQRSFCSHVHPRWGLTECQGDCSHVVDTDEIWIDGIVVDTTYYYADTAVV